MKTSQTVTKIGAKGNRTVTKTVKKTPFLKNAAQRTKVELAKLNQSTTKSAISEIGKTARNMTAQIAAGRAYQQSLASKQFSNLSKGQDSAIALYNRLVEGNPEQAGDSGKTSTTEVGGNGSAIGG